MNGLIPTHLSAVQFFAASIATITNFMQELMLQLLIKHLASKIVRSQNKDIGRDVSEGKDKE